MTPRLANITPTRDADIVPLLNGMFRVFFKQESPRHHHDVKWQGKFVQDYYSVAQARYARWKWMNKRDEPCHKPKPIMGSVRPSAIARSHGVSAAKSSVATPRHSNNQMEMHGI